MAIELTPQQTAAQEKFRSFAEERIVPFARQWDREEKLPLELIREMGTKGLLASFVPTEYGGENRDAISLGLLHQELGRGCSSVRGAVNVIDIVAQAILRTGSDEQKRCYLPLLTSGQVLPAFCLSEAGAGSDVRAIETTARASGDSFEINGAKKWITLGQCADLFLVLAKTEEAIAGFIVEKNTPGIRVSPIPDLLGMRAAYLSEVTFNACKVPRNALIGPVSKGFPFVVNTALDLGRYCVAWGCLGIAQGCLDASLAYSKERVQFGVPIGDHQLIRSMVSQMVAEVEAAKLLCLSAGLSREANNPSSIRETLIAKYFASRAANRVAADAVQIHGAHGCASEYPVQRYFRDARVMEIIEGSSQMHELLIARYSLG